MYILLLPLHSLWRWLVLISLVSSVYLSYHGLRYRKAFTVTANSVRHWTATIAHIQLLLGMAVYLQSPVVKYPMLDSPFKLMNEQTFFRYYHLLAMLTAVVLITIGSAKAKREKQDLQKYKTMLIWFGSGLLIVLLAIPWPFSPLAGRPYIRNF